MSIRYAETPDKLYEAFSNLKPVCRCGAIMEIDEETDTCICPACGAYYPDVDEYLNYNPYSDLLEDSGFITPEQFAELSKPGEGCEACGNPAYPNCMMSCSLFDD